MSTPTLGGIGSLSPAGLNGYAPSTQLGSQADSSADADGFGTALVPGHHHPAAALDVDDEDPEYKTWKQVTKRDRARVAAERHRLFKDGGINKEEPALMRTRVGMRRWMRKHRRVLAENLGGDDYSPAGMGPDAAARAAPGEGGGGESLAEDIAGEDNDVSRMLPEYYDVANGVPDLPPQLQWVEDEDGQLRQPADQDLYIVPNGHFTAPDSMLTRKLDANMRQIQETRKVCAKIGIVKQMQLQSQVRAIPQPRP
jgi:transcriptional activator SPT7